MTEKQAEGKEAEGKQKYCGIIMPIARLDDYSAEHWMEVKSIIIEATQLVEDIDFKTEIVSNSDGEIDVIHKRIIQNIYNADIVVCDISGKNPNVLFELGMRLTFDKPTIIIKDDATDFMFDTGVIEHLTYPKDLRFQKVVNFKRELASRIKLTYEKSQRDPNFSTFLGSFGEFKVPNLKQTTVSNVEQHILDEILNFRSELSSLKKEINYSSKLNKKRIYDTNTNNLKLLHDLTTQYLKQNTNLIEAGPDEIILSEKYRSYLLELGFNVTRYNPEKVYAVIKEAQEDIAGYRLI
ncbi:RNA helicase [Priestia megaterium]|uniref:RNA helicase n=1 Tax=Priestia megaterium TaxID=1404 RepID=UPI00159C203C|nr:RNA helicase [Priestia megaterium]